MYLKRQLIFALVVAPLALSQFESRALATCTKESLVSAKVSPSQVVPGGSYTVNCNYGASSNAITTNLATAGAYGSCKFSAFSGTTAVYTCKAGTAVGSWAATCNLVDISPNYYCARTDSAGSIVVKAAPAPTPTPTPTPTPSPSNFTPPALVNPVSPLSYGARCDGVTDDTGAFQSAVNASDVMVPAGKTCVINGEVNIQVSNRHIQCGAGTTLKQTIVGPNMFNYSAPSSSARLTGDSIVDCNFLGVNTVAPEANWNNSADHYNTPIETTDRVDHFFLAGNSFAQFWGQAMFQTYGSVDGGTGDIIEYNTFKSCAYYGPVFVAHTNGYIGHNTMVDCATGVENDNSSQDTGGNIIEYNTLSCIYGYGAADMGGCAMITGGVTADADYSANIVRYNSVSGVANSSGAHPGEPSLIDIEAHGAEAKPAQYLSNTCTNGCIVHQ